jgi:hypothetical protein
MGAERDGEGVRRERSSGRNVDRGLILQEREEIFAPEPPLATTTNAKAP